jgi:hypothetical protein
MADGLSKQYADLLTGSYDCDDTIRTAMRGVFQELGLAA